jgi:hypothetical protein
LRKSKNPPIIARLYFFILSQENRNPPTNERYFQN